MTDHVQSTLLKFAPDPVAYDKSRQSLQAAFNGYKDCIEMVGEKYAIETAVCTRAQAALDNGLVTYHTAMCVSNLLTLASQPLKLKGRLKVTIDALQEPLWDSFGPACLKAAIESKASKHGRAKEARVDG